MIKQCLVCSKEFVTYPSKIKLGKGKYCSKQCCLSVTNKILEENGKKNRFVKGHKNHNAKGWSYAQSRKGGRKYIEIYMPEHPYCTKRGYVRLHRLIMEQHIGRHLTKEEVVHHIDENTLNNDINNLELMTWKEHRKHHLKDNIHKRWT